MIQPVYFFYFLSVGVSMPFFPPYLRGLGLSGRQIATVLAIIPLFNLGLPLAWAFTADRTRRHARVLSVACLGAALGYLPMVLARSFTQVFVCYLLFAAFAAGIGTLMDSMAISMVLARAGGGAEYGRVRLWGSIGYIASALTMGEILTLRGGRPADPWVPGAIAAALLTTFAASSRVTGPGGEQSRLPTRKDVRALLADRRLRLLLTVAPLHWIGCAPYNVFFGIFVRDRHLPPVVLGAALAAGVIAEMIVLLHFAQLRRRFSLESLFIAAFAGTALRWALMPLCERTLAVVSLQLFHGLTFGLFWGAGMAWIGDCVPATLRATGQSLFVMSMLGVGSIVGYWLTGLVYDAAGAVGPAFIGAAALELVPLGLVVRAVRRQPRPAVS